MHILTISGSQRTGSFNTAVIRALPDLIEGHEFAQLDYAALPLFSQDLEQPFLEEAIRIKGVIQAADAIVISTPEHNRSIPAALKNLLDWTSRPYGDNAWAGKPVYVMGAGGPVGTALAQADVRKVLLYLDARVMGQPESYIASPGEKIGEDGTLTDQRTKEHLAKALAAFVGFAAR